MIAQPRDNGRRPRIARLAAISFRSSGFGTFAVFRDSPPNGWCPSSAGTGRSGYIAAAGSAETSAAGELDATAGQLLCRNGSLYSASA